ncbi:hypothetical protein AURDEDRAFT_120364 [Auricularia subglabra TFB-10046 SS5]|nr:hypothetical protein AURDEDRAFT_120364 [Auricularia subglabra TFB-10046 SS5]
MSAVVLESKSLELPLPCTAPRASTDSGERTARSRLERARNITLVLMCILLLAWLLAALFSKDGHVLELHFSVSVSGRVGMNFDMDVHNKRTGAGHAISSAPRAAWNAARAYWSGGVDHGVHSV